LSLLEDEKPIFERYFLFGNHCLALDGLFEEEPLAEW
jgi:hypothetical protein